MNIVWPFIHQWPEFCKASWLWTLNFLTSKPGSCLSLAVVFEESRRGCLSCIVRHIQQILWTFCDLPFLSYKRWRCRQTDSALITAWFSPLKRQTFQRYKFSASCISCGTFLLDLKVVCHDLVMWPIFTFWPWNCTVVATFFSSFRFLFVSM